MAPRKQNTQQAQEMDAETRAALRNTLALWDRGNTAADLVRAVGLENLSDLLARVQNAGQRSPTFLDEILKDQDVDATLEKTVQKNTTSSQFDKEYHEQVVNDGVTAAKVAVYGFFAYALAQEQGLTTDPVDVFIAAHAAVFAYRTATDVTKSDFMESLAVEIDLLDDLSAALAESIVGGKLVPDSPIAKAIEAARKKEHIAPDVTRVTAVPTESLKYPLDKPNSKLWNTLAIAADQNGQYVLELNFDAAKKEAAEDALIYCSLSFDEQEAGLHITSKTLNAYDKMVYISAAALYNAGNTIMTASQIYKMMGNKGNAPASQLQKIDDSLTKMGVARIHINNAMEAQRTDYPRYKYDAPLLPFERVTAYINGIKTDSAIHLFREPPLIEFAKKRNQIIGIERKLLESPISKTDDNLRLEDYLLTEISRMKNPKSNTPKRMLYETIYARCGIDTKMKRSRAPDKIQKYLDHFKECNWIAGYKMDDKGVSIQL